MQKEIFIEGLGKVTLKRSSRSRYMRLMVNLKDGIVAVIPEGVPEKFILRFLNEKKSWLKKSLSKQENLRSQFTLFTHDCIYQTRSHRLYLQTHESKTVKSRVGNHKIIIWYPEHADVTDERIQKVIRRAVIEAWRIEAKDILPERVRELAAKHNLNYAKLTVKNAKTRWGSCSSENNINLNLQLMRLPEEMIDYVILHELCHTVHRHHQKSFWHALEQILPEARKLDKALNKYHLEYW